MKSAAMTIKSLYHEYSDWYLGQCPLPYTEALDPINYPQPKYDTQDVIYSDLIAQLGTATGMLSEEDGDLSAGDLL